jgi:hypothetical protein
MEGYRTLLTGTEGVFRSRARLYMEDNEQNGINDESQS